MNVVNLKWRQHDKKACGFDVGKISQRISECAKAGRFAAGEKSA